MILPDTPAIPTPAASPDPALAWAKKGDILLGFSTTGMWLSRLIRWATGSKYSHAWIRHGSEVWGGDWITQADLPALMEFLHRRGVRGYVTFNTLVFANELADAEDYLRTILAAGVDAAIVQDVGICRMIRALSPDFPIHCSTQMTITSAAGIEFARELGAQLVVLARENSIAEIERMQAAQAGKAAPLTLEVFVHGALCVAYSGQCLTSESLGGRSANRGE